MKMLINGKAAGACGGECFDVKNPATGELLEQVPRGTEDDIALAVEAAVSAFEGWASTSPQQRGMVFTELQELSGRGKRSLLLCSRRNRENLLQRPETKLKVSHTFLNTTAGLQAVCGVTLSLFREMGMPLP